MLVTFKYTIPDVRKVGMSGWYARYPQRTTFLKNSLA